MRLLMRAKKRGLALPARTPLVRALPAAVKLLSRQKPVKARGTPMRKRPSRTAALAALRGRIATRRARRERALQVTIASRPAETDRGDRLVSVAEVADRCSLSKETVYSMVKRGRLFGLKVGSALRVRESSVQAFIAGKR